MFAKVGSWGAGEVWRLISGEFSSNSYFCTHESGGCLIIDGGLDAEEIISRVKSMSDRVDGMLCTHGHFDHAGAAFEIQSAFDCPVFLHGADEKILKSSNFLLMACKLRSRIKQPVDLVKIAGGESFVISNFPIQFHWYPGHTPGSCVIQLGSALFTGDTLYARGFGLSKLPGENSEQLKRSLIKIWPMLKKNRLICPGHGECADGETVQRFNKQLRAFVGIKD